MSKQIHVAVGVIRDQQDRVLIAKRAAAQHQGGLWEFPGGKVESGESVLDALKREFKEEVALDIHDAKPLIQISHDYGDKSVLLDVYQSQLFSGSARGMEGQPVEWCPIDLLHEKAFPAANTPIIDAICLPAFIQISPDFYAGWLDDLQNCLSVSRASWLHIRCPSLVPEALMGLLQQARPMLDAFGCRVSVNTAPELFDITQIDGIHLSSQRLMSYEERPVPTHCWLSASCHNLAQLRHAEAIGVNYVFISPVLHTASHPADEPMGWERFKQLAQQCKVPCYALGGMLPSMIDESQRYGAQGVAAIRATWKR